MKSYISQLLGNEKIEYFGILPLNECKVINPRLYERTFESWTPKSVIVLLVPYYSGAHKGRNISLYAVPRDYHLFFKGLYSRVEKELTRVFPNNHFKGLSDHSPISEVAAAAKCGLGVIGDKYQLINDKYGSYTFIGEIYTDAEFPDYDTVNISYCSHCGACREACPIKGGCLSEITQKKGVLSAEDELLMIQNKTLWGCDICREVCPMNTDPEITPIEFFRTDLIPVLDRKTIEGMTKEQFSSRAYSWRGKKTILRNIELFERIAPIK